MSTGIPAGWAEHAVADVIEEIPRRASVPKGEYLPTGRFPIVDQGAQPVAGYTNDSDPVISKPLPLIVFGDHTRVLKLVERPFAPGADGTKLLAATDGVDIHFLYFALRAIEIPSRGYNRHIQQLRESRIRMPVQIDEQRAIAAVLLRLELALGTQQRRVGALSSAVEWGLRELAAGRRRLPSRVVEDLGRVP